jgi:hypothetical protein
MKGESWARAQAWNWYFMIPSRTRVIREKIKGGENFSLPQVRQP